MKQDFTLHPQLSNDTLPVCTLKLCTVRIHKNSELPWFILVPRVKGIVELTDLTPRERSELYQEIELVSELVGQCFSPHKINLGALGNLVPQFHFHVVARFKGDKAWPGPVWGRSLFQNEAVTKKWRQVLLAALNLREEKSFKAL